VTPWIRLLPLLLLLGSRPLFADSGFRSLPAAVELSYEELTLAAGEDMGLIGLGLRAHAYEDWHLGAAVYGAARGERGGFFTGGLSAAWRPPLGADWRLDTGVFVGAGGGGSAPQGGGLMLRGHAGLALPTRLGDLGLGWSWIEFPNGSISSDQVAVTFSRPLELFLRDGWRGGEPVDVDEAFPDRYFHPLDQRFDAVIIATRPRAGTAGVDGRPHDEANALVGVAWESGLGEGVALELSLAGAAGGGADGYAQIMTDLGYRMPLAPGDVLRLSGGVGLGGGGRVDTGGGFLVRGALVWEHELGHGFHSRLGGGMTGAPGGGYRTTDLLVGLGRSFRVPVATGGWRVPGSSYYLPRDLRVRVYQQWESAPDGLRRKGGEAEQRLGLGGAAIDVRVGRHGFLSGHALAAHDGGAGGYAVGLAGGGLRRALSGGVDLELELLAGAAGGGGVDVDGGVVGQATVTLGLELHRAARLRVGYGRSGPLSRGLDRDVLRVGVGVRFSGLAR